MCFPKKDNHLPNLHMNRYLVPSLISIIDKDFLSIHRYGQYRRQPYMIPNFAHPLFCSALKSFALSRRASTKSHLRSITFYALYFALSKSWPIPCPPCAPQPIPPCAPVDIPSVTWHLIFQTILQSAADLLVNSISYSSLYTSHLFFTL